MKYKAICFDVDGTLYPMKWFNKCCRPLRFRFPFAALKYIKVRSLFREYQKDFDKIGLGNADIYTREAAMMLKLSGNKKEKLEDAKRKLAKIYKWLEKGYDRLPVFPDVVATMKKIKNSKCLIAIYSDWPLFNKLERIGIKDLVDAAYDCEDTGYVKPYSECFNYFVEKLNIKPEEILYVGDSYSKDILGAHSVGMDSVLVNCNPENRKNFPEALEVFGKWSDFDKWLSELLES